MSRKKIILETALKLFNETNTQSATTNHIAKEMGISPGNLHYHYKNREEIIRLLYIQMKEKTSLAIVDLPKTFDDILQHQKLLICVQWEYRFFFREILFLLSRDEVLKELYIKDNIAHRQRIVMVTQNLIDNGELIGEASNMKEYIVDIILMTWQFYTSHMQTLGRVLNKTNIQEAVNFTNNAMEPYKRKN